MKPSRLLELGLLATLGAAAAVWMRAARLISVKSQGLLFDAVDAIPPRRVGLVLGCAPRLRDGRANRYLVERLDAAARLFHAGKVEYLLVSGDARHPGRDEPAAMREGLLARAVPDRCIVVDPLGLRTLDSIVRARDVYGLVDFTIVSQRFHNERAVYLALALGLSVVAYDAMDPPTAHDKMRIREPLARLAAILDLYVLETRPTTLGPRVTIGEDPRS